MDVITKTFQLSDGREVSIETGKLAKQADGSVVVSIGDAKLLATVVSSQEAKEGVNFLPLSVDYQEKFLLITLKKLTQAVRFQVASLKEKENYRIMKCLFVD